MIKGSLAYRSKSRAGGVLAFLLGFLLVPPGSILAAEEEEEFGVKQFREDAVVLPANPVPENLLPFYVAATSDNRFAIDAASLSVGADAVIRYTLVIETAGGARNVSYEGMRCEARELRLYASGRQDGTWSSARNSAWRPIRDNSLNRHHAALYYEYFCPMGAPVRSVREAQDALRKGGHTDAVRGRQ
jgi:hypothetical protein